MGGTKTLFGLFERDRTRPRTLVVRDYATADPDSFQELTKEFLNDTSAA